MWQGDLLGSGGFCQLDPVEIPLVELGATGLGGACPSSCSSAPSILEKPRFS